MQPPEVTPQRADGPTPLTPPLDPTGAASVAMSFRCVHNLHPDTCIYCNTTAHENAYPCKEPASDTPLTDANQQTWDRANEEGCSADFARTLERDKAKVEQEINEWQVMQGALVENMQAEIVKRQQAEAFASTESDLRDGMEKRCVHEIKLREKAEAELSTLHAQLDAAQRDIETLRTWVDQCGFYFAGTPHQRWADKAILVLKETNRAAIDSNQSKWFGVAIERLREIQSLRLRGCAGTDFVAREEVGRDTARLDWLEKNKPWIHNAASGYTKSFGYKSPYWGIALKHTETRYGETFRAAIDAASATTTTEGKQP